MKTELMTTAVASLSLNLLSDGLFSLIALNPLLGIAAIATLLLIIAGVLLTQQPTQK